VERVLNARDEVNEMKFNPHTGRLYSGNNQLLKKLECPLGAGSAKIVSNGNNVYTCADCDRSLVSIDLMTETEVELLLENKPDQCLLIPIGSQNVEIVIHDRE
jgi:hypothetical protein